MNDWSKQWYRIKEIDNELQCWQHWHLHYRYRNLLNENFKDIRNCSIEEFIYLLIPDTATLLVSS
jgi:hypothetical protein